MSAFDVIKTVAPWIGTALTGGTGGPLVSMAINAAANALGVDSKTVDDVKNAIIGATPEQMLALKNADQSFQAHMQEIGFKQITDLEQIAADDRKDARDMQKSTHSVMPAVLTTIITIGFFGVLFTMLMNSSAQENPPLLIMLGSLGTAWTGSCAYWFGTTRDSGNKTNLLAQAQSINKG